MFQVDLTHRHCSARTELRPICAGSISANSTISGYFSDCLDRLATARERTSSLCKLKTENPVKRPVKQWECDSTEHMSMHNLFLTMVGRLAGAYT